MSADDPTQPDPSSTQESKPGCLRQLARWAGRFLLGLVILIVLALLIVQTSFFKDKLRSQLESILADSLAGRVTIGKIGGNLLTHVELEDVRVFDAKDRLAVHVSYASASYALTSLLEGGLVLEEVRVKEALGIVRYDEDGTLNLATIAKPTPSDPAATQSTFAVDARSIEVTGSAALFLDMRSEQARTNLGPVVTLLADSKDLRAGQVAPKLTPLLRATSAATPSAFVPTLATLSQVEIKARFLLDANGHMQIGSQALGALLDANTWVRPQPLTSKELRVKFTPTLLTVEHESLQFGAESGWKDLAAALRFGPKPPAPAPTPGATTDEPEPSAPLEHIALSAPAISFSRSLLLSIFPTQDIPSGATFELAASGTPKDLQARLKLGLEAGDGRLDLWARVQDVLSELLAGRPLEEAKDARAALKLEASSLNLSLAWPTLPPTDLNFALQAQAQGLTPQTLQVQLHAQLRQSSGLGYEITRGNLDLLLKDQTLTLLPSLILTPYGKLEAKGEGALGGAFDFTFDLESKPSGTQTLNVPGGVSLRHEEVDVNLRLWGNLEPESDQTTDPLDLIKDAHLKASWALGMVDLKDTVTLEGSTGDIQADLVPKGPGAKALDTVVDANVQGLVTKDLALRSASLRAKAKTRLSTPLVPEQVLEALDATLTLRAAGFRGFGSKVDRASVDLTLAPGPRGRVTYDADLQVGAVTYAPSKLTLGKGAIEAEGTLGLDLEGGGLTYLGAKGNGQVERFVLDTTNVGEANVRFDLQGVPPNLSGSVTLDGQDIVAGPEQLSALRASVDLAPDGQFDLDAKVSRQNQALANLRLTAQGKLVDSFQGVQGLQAALYDLDKSGQDPLWRLEGATIDWGRGALRFEQVNLINDDQRLSLTGNLLGPGKQSFSANAQNIRLGQLRQELGLQAILPPIEGEVERLQLEVSGDARTPEVVIDILLKDFYYQEVGPFTLALDGRYMDQALVLRKLDLDGFGLDLVRINGKVPLDINLARPSFKLFWERPILLTTIIDPIDLARLDDGLEPIKALALTLGGKVEGGGIINGTLRSPKLDVTLKGDSVSFVQEFNQTQGRENIVLRDISFLTKIEYDPPQGDQGGLRSQSEVTWEGIDVLKSQLSLPLPLSEWAYQTVERGGNVNFVRESFAQPLFVQTIIKDLDLAKLTQTRLLHPLELAGVANLNIDGQGTLGAPRLEAEIRAEDLDVTGRLGAQRLDLRGIALNLQTRLEPTSASNSSLDLSAGMDYRGQRILKTKNSLRLPLQSWLRRVLIESKSVNYAAELMDQPYLVDFVLKDLDLQTVAISPLLSKPDAAGIVNASITGEGVLRNPTLEVAMSVGQMGVDNQGRVTSSGGFGWDRYRDVVVTLDASLRDKMISVDKLFVNWDTTDILTAFGKAPLPVDTIVRGAPLEDLPLDMALEIHPVPLNKLSAVNYDFAKYSGVLRGHLITKGSLRNPDLNTRLALYGTQLSQGRTGTLSIEAHADRDIVTLDAGVCEGESDLLKIEAQLRTSLDILALANGADPLEIDPGRRPSEKLPADQDLHVVAKTHEGKSLDLARIMPGRLIEGVIEEIEGKLRMDVEIKGTYDAPVPRGRVELKDAALTVSQLGRRFRDIQLGLGLDEDSIDLERLQVREGEDARIRVDGRIEHKNLELGELNLSADSKDFNIGDFVGIPFFVDAKVKMQGDLAQTPMLATVDISGLDVQLTEDFGGSLHPTELTEDVVVVRARNQAEENAVEGAAEELLLDTDNKEGPLAANIRVKVGRDSWVRHPYGDVNFTGDITAYLDGPEVRLGGQVETLRGQVEFLGRVFRVGRGLVSFTGASPPEPRLQLEAIYELDRSVADALAPPSEGDARIIVRVVGPAAEPQLKLQSDPALSDTDILYILATNRPPNTADVGQESSVASAALSAASGLVVGLLKDELSDTLPLDFFDVLRIDTNNFEVGKYVYNGKIYLAYRYLFASANDDGQNVYEFEYHFAPRWTLETQGRNSTQNSELLFNVFWDLY